jgi:hypothetical protein
MTLMFLVNTLRQKFKRMIRKSEDLKSSDQPPYTNRQATRVKVNCNVI